MGHNKYENLWFAYCEISSLISAFDSLEEFGSEYRNEITDSAVTEIVKTVKRNVDIILHQSDDVKKIIEQL